MGSEELMLIERLGIGGSAFFLVYLLLKKMQDKAFEQSDKILKLAENVIQENTKTLQQMRDAMEAHIKQKEPFIEEVKECRRSRDVFLDKLTDRRTG